VGGECFGEEIDARLQIGLGRGTVVDVVADGGFLEQAFNQAPEPLLDCRFHGSIICLAQFLVAEKTSELRQDFRPRRHGSDSNMQGNNYSVSCCLMHGAWCSCD